MSYILDALKKSSEERRKREAEQKTTFQAMEEAVSRSTKPRTGSAMRLFLSLAVIAAASATGIWIFFHSHGAPERESIVKQTIDKAADGRIVESAPRTKTLPVEATAVPESVSSHARTSPSISPSSTKKMEPGLIPPPPEPRKESPPLMQELPFGIQSTLPEMKFSGHVFSQTPALRMIMINTDIVREKEMVAADLRLLEITENGLIMEFRGTRFRVELF